MSNVGKLTESAYHLDATLHLLCRREHPSRRSPSGISVIPVFLKAYQLYFLPRWTDASTQHSEKDIGLLDVRRSDQTVEDF
jgi:hypothetical protein